MSDARIYARQSEDVPEGIERQLERCRKLVAARGLNLVNEYADNETKASRSRGPGTAWAQMLDQIRPGDIVVAVDVDRLLRGQRDLLDLIESGALVLTVDGEIDLASADGEFRATMLAALARFEIRRKGERQRRANEARAAKGFPVAGKRRFGFLPRNIEAHPDEAPLVRWAFETCAAGGTIYGIAKELEKPTIRIREILTNPCYSGYVVRHGERFEAHESIARIVPRELFEDVQVILSDTSRKTTPGPQRKHLASGLARCGVCNRNLIAMIEYQCPDPSRHVWIRRAELDAALVEGVRDELMRLAEEPPAAIESAEARTLRAERDTLGRQRERAQKLAVLEDVDLVALQRDLRRIKIRVGEIEARLADIALATRADGILEIARDTGLLLDTIAAEQRPWTAGELFATVAAGEAWDAAWSATSLEDRRALVADLLDVTVHSARAAARPATFKRVRNKKTGDIELIKAKDARSGPPRVDITPKRQGAIT